jgi:uncharacterized OB-fold protein
MRPLPSVDGPDRPFWQALRGGEVQVQCCTACGSHRFPATRFCPRCRSDASEWRVVTPTGIVETWCTFHRPYFEGLDVPYTVLQVRLDCGVRLYSNPVGVGPETLRIGMPVEAAFEEVAPDVILLKFKPRKDF